MVLGQMIDGICYYDFIDAVLKEEGCLSEDVTEDAVKKWLKQASLVPLLGTATLLV